MRRITLAIASTIAALVLLLSYRTSGGGGVATQAAAPAHVVTAPTTASSPSGQGPTPAPGSAIPTGSNAAPSAPTSSTAPSAAQTAQRVAQGAVEMIPYGPVQVQVTVTAGRITDVTATQQPSQERRSQEINAIALPELRSEVLAAQSAHIDGVSGATLTTDGYVASLQSALDALHFAA